MNLVMDCQLMISKLHLKTCVRQNLKRKAWDHAKITENNLIYTNKNNLNIYK